MQLSKKILFSILIFLITLTTQASQPLWTFTPLTATNVSLPTTDTATIQYLLTNQSSKPHTLMMQPINGVSQMTDGSGSCNIPFTLRAQQSCILSLQVTGSALTADLVGGPVVCQQGNHLQCYQPSQADGLAIHLISPTVTITPSISSLALSVACASANASCAAVNTALTGNVRQIDITNYGNAAATNLSVSGTGLPAGTSFSLNTCQGTLNAGDSCSITVTPGAIASLSAQNTPCTAVNQPIPGTITVAADGISSQVEILVLGYGCIYQGGYVYAIDDTTARDGSIGGKVVSLADQAPATTPGQYNGVIWSSKGNGSGSGHGPNATFYASNDLLPGIDEVSTTSIASPSYNDFYSFFTTAYGTAPATGLFTACNGSTDGACNSMNILDFYNEYITNCNLVVGCTSSPGPTNLTYYAAGFCTATIDGYSDWYLPAICEMGPASNGSGCLTGIQNMANSLPLLIGVYTATTPSTSCDIGSSCLAGDYWSSTEFSGTAQYEAWIEEFNTGATIQFSGEKDYVAGVRCSRALTP